MTKVVNPNASTINASKFLAPTKSASASLEKTSAALETKTSKEAAALVSAKKPGNIDKLELSPEARTAIQSKNEQSVLNIADIADVNKKNQTAAAVHQQNNTKQQQGINIIA